MFDLEDSMIIIVALDDVVRDVESAWFQYSCSKQEIRDKILIESISTATSEEWLDYKSLIPPRPLAEDKINAWFDTCREIHILAYKDEYNIKWLRDHFIPYDSIIEFPTMNHVDYFISASLHDCLDMSCRTEIKKIFHFKTHKRINNLDYMIPSNANPEKITTVMNWSKIIIEEK